MENNFEIFDGIKIPVIRRKKGKKQTDACPFCKQSHTHGIGEGHRVAHCGDTVESQKTMDSALLSDGTYAPPKRGYILREY